MSTSHYEAGIDPTVRSTAVYVYEAPVRLWHWVNAFCLLTLMGTGYWIGTPLLSLSGEASDHYLMGYVRFVHFAAGYILGIGFLFRAIWAFFGNSHSRQMFYIPVTNGRYWGELFHEIRWYLFLAKEPKKYVGHNPLAQFFMFTTFLLVMIVMICTGFAMYGEGTGHGSWASLAFTSWVVPLLGHNTMTLHLVHRIGMWVIATFALIHVYAAVREDIMSRQSLISTMISGWRMFKDDRP